MFEIIVEFRRYELYEYLTFTPLLLQASKLHFAFDQAEPELNVMLVEWQFTVASILDCSGIIILVLFVVIYHDCWRGPDLYTTRSCDLTFLDNLLSDFRP